MTQSNQGINRRRFVVTAATQATGAALAATAAAAECRPAPESAAPRDSSASPGCDEAETVSSVPNAEMRLHVLGGGCPDPTPSHYGSSFLLQIGTEFLMIDCGPATTYKMVRAGIRPTKVNHLFLTHHHFDHNVDFPCFALTRWDLSTGARPPLKVFGPEPTEQFVERLLGKEGAFFNDWNSRIHHPVSQAIHRRRGGKLPRPAPAIEANNVGPGPVAKTNSWAATATVVHHVEPWLTSLAFRFNADQGSIVFAGDCGDCGALRELAQDADTLVIACVYIGRTKAYADIITGTAQVAEIAASCGIKRVVLSHAAPGFSKPGVKRRAIDDVRHGYDGTVCFPDEMTVVDL
jgi:ribonuclease BN (tRNA processing enzyme)